MPEYIPYCEYITIFVHGVACAVNRHWVNNAGGTFFCQKPAKRLHYYHYFIFNYYNAGMLSGVIISKADIGKPTGPRSSTGENSGGPVKTRIVPVLLSGKKIAVGSPSIGILILKKKIGLVKVLEDQ